MLAALGRATAELCRAEHLHSLRSRRSGNSAGLQSAKACFLASSTCVARHCPSRDRRGQNDPGPAMVTFHPHWSSSMVEQEASPPGCWFNPSLQYLCCDGTRKGRLQSTDGRLVRTCQQWTHSIAAQDTAHRMLCMQRCETTAATMLWR